MGTPEFAVPSLQILVENGYQVVGVVTAADKLGGRGKKQLLESAVKKYAVSRGIPVLQPVRLRDPGFLESLRRLEGDLFVVVAFRMLPEVVWSMPEHGTFNLHGSLLPKYRGAAPINWAIINGETETGVTTFFIKQEIDTGDLLLQKKMPIGDNETAGEVHDRMKVLGAEAVLETVRAIESGGYTLEKQDDSLATKAPKIFHETCEIDFSQPVQQVHDFIRGLSPYPAAWTRLDGKVLKILRTAIDHTPHELAPGTFLSDNKEWLKVATQGGFVFVHELQMEGRRRMLVGDFLNGYFF
ncbi:MAG: methionyl-tRNA formyltransferase [Lewinellaceae bacterium]|nr:methionyl-tRNA formyltransferase [Lewinellaceae bacterium]